MAKLLGPFSIVRTISGIQPKQRAYLEAIGFGLDTVDAVYVRLADLLANLTGIDAEIELIFADAYAVVDWIHRLDWLVRHCPGLSERDQPVTDFLNTSSLVENTRHDFQHPGDALMSTVASGSSLWGHLAWQRQSDRGRITVGITPFGRDPARFRFPAGVDQPPRSKIDRVSLFSHDVEVEIGITGQHEAAVRFGRRLEAAVRASERPEDGEIMRIQTWPEDPAGP